MKVKTVWSLQKKGWSLKPETEQRRWWGWIWIKAAVRDFVMSKLIIFLCSLYSHFLCLILSFDCNDRLCLHIIKDEYWKSNKEDDRCHPSWEERQKGRTFPLQSWIVRVSLTHYGMTLQDFPYSVAHWHTRARVHWHLGALALSSYDMTVWKVEGGEGLHSSSYRHTYLLTTHVTQICWSIYDSICESLLPSPFNHLNTSHY